jgi:hypothetical protein
LKTIEAIEKPTLAEGVMINKILPQDKNLLATTKWMYSKKETERHTEKKKKSGQNKENKLEENV